MPFQTPITVKEAIDDIHSKKYLLPAIQRELVWAPEQIERLFDSLMRDYPIGSFLFWYVEKSRSQDFQFYEFIREFHQRDSRHNAKANVDGEADIIAILDGQQRLTSLYLGLRGSYAFKEAKKRWDNDAAFPARKLHLNLLKRYAGEEELDLKYDFAFLTEQEAKQRNGEDYFWFRVGEILGFKEHYEVNNYLIANGLMNRPAEKSIFANRTLFKLFSVIHEERVINYFLEKNEALDKVLNIFVRINSAGTPLSYSDLLLSIASASWKERDAREEIIGFVGEISRIGDGFDFSKDFVLKTSLVLCDLPDIAFKVDNFNKKNMLTIEQRWEEITKAIRLTISLVAGYGYNRDTLTSSYALIPIAYYLLKTGAPDNFVQAGRYRTERDKINRWLTLSLLKRTFSGTPDNVLRPVRQVIDKTHDSFPLSHIIDELRGKPKSLTFNEDEIDNLFKYNYASHYTFATLAVLYPTLDFRNKFHIDHIHPRSSFTKRKLDARGIPDEKIDFYLDNFDLLANLQLLEGVPNMEKSGKRFDEWLAEVYETDQAKRDFMARHYIPDVDLSLENFAEFIGERKRLMVAEFERLLKL